MSVAKIVAWPKAGGPEHVYAETAPGQPASVVSAAFGNLLWIDGQCYDLTTGGIASSALPTCAVPSGSDATRIIGLCRQANGTTISSTALDGTDLHSHGSSTDQLGWLGSDATSWYFGGKSGVVYRMPRDASGLTVEPNPPESIVPRVQWKATNQNFYGDGEQAWFERTEAGGQPKKVISGLHDVRRAITVGGTLFWTEWGRSRVHGTEGRILRWP
jgi:hypothetical protein